MDTIKREKPDQRKLLVALFLPIILVFAFLKIKLAQSAPLWFDEGFTYYYVLSQNLGELFQRMRIYELTPFLFYLFCWLTVKIFNSTDVLIMRLIPLGLSFVSPVLLYVLGKEVFGKDRISHLAAILLFASSFFTFITCDARSYSPAILFVILGVIYYLRLLKSEKYSFLLFCISWIAAISLHYYSALVFGIVFLHYLVFNRGKQASDFWVGSLLVALSFVIHVSGFLVHLRTSPFMPGIASFFDIFEFFFVCLAGFTLKFPHMAIWYAISISSMILLLYPVFAKDEKKSEILLFAAIPVVYFTFIFCVSKFLGLRVFSTRYMALTLPFYFLLVSYTIGSIRAVWLKAAVVALILFVNFSSTKTLVYEPEFQRNDFRAAAAIIKQDLKPGDGLVLVHGYQKFLLQYYLPEMPEKNSFYIDAGDPENFNAKALKKYPRVWLVLSHPRMSDPGLLAYKQIYANMELLRSERIERRNPDYNIDVLLFDWTDVKR